MKFIKIEDVEVHESEGDIFTGGKVYAQFVVNDQIAKKINVGVIKFNAGARNKFHTHTGEQILIITEGKGIVATEDKETVVTPGTVIYVSPGEKHWHGGTKDSSMTHIAILESGSIEVFEK